MGNAPARPWIWLALILQFLGDVLDAVWHGLLLSRCPCPPPPVGVALDTGRRRRTAESRRAVQVVRCERLLISAQLEARGDAFRAAESEQCVV
jgi:hypothetical protein